MHTGSEFEIKAYSQNLDGKTVTQIGGVHCLIEAKKKVNLCNLFVEPAFVNTSNAIKDKLLQFTVDYFGHHTKLNEIYRDINGAEYYNEIGLLVDNGFTKRHRIISNTGKYMTMTLSLEEYRRNHKDSKYKNIEKISKDDYYLYFSKGLVP